MSQESEWSKAENYSYTEDLDASGWAWEFLRRNREYRQDYQQANTYENLDDLQKASVKKAYVPEKEIDETEREWLSRVIYSNKNVKMEWQQTKFARKWHLNNIYDPSKREPVPAFVMIKQFPFFIEKIDDLDEFTKSENVYSDSAARKDAPAWEESGSILTVDRSFSLLIFDLTQSIPDQIQLANKKLKKIQKTLKAEKLIKTYQSYTSTENWRKHLMTLDIIDNLPNITDKKLAEILGYNSELFRAPEEAGRDYRTHAEWMRTKGKIEAMIRRIYSKEEE